MTDCYGYIEFASNMFLNELEKEALNIEEDKDNQLFSQLYKHSEYLINKIRTRAASSMEYCHRAGIVPMNTTSPKQVRVREKLIPMHTSWHFNVSDRKDKDSSIMEEIST